jgi:hypothetical protein
MNPLHKHAQELDGAFTAIGRRLDACETPAQVHAYLDELEAEIIETAIRRRAARARLRTRPYPHKHPFL